MGQFIFYTMLAVAMIVPGASPAQEIGVSDIESAIMQEEYKKANDMARIILKTRSAKDPDARVDYYLGLSYLRLGEYRAAYDAFRKAAEVSTDVELGERAVIGVVDALYMQGQYDKALKEAMSLMRRHPHSEMMGLIYLKAARANLKLTHWGKARDFLQKIMQEYPDSFESRIARQLLEEKQYFTVQVGAFLDQARAQQLVKELIARHQYAYIIETKSPDGRKFFRVRVGQMTALKDARMLEDQLSGFGYPTLIYP